MDFHRLAITERAVGALALYGYCSKDKFIALPKRTLEVLDKKRKFIYLEGEYGPIPTGKRLGEFTAFNNIMVNNTHCAIRLFKLGNGAADVYKRFDAFNERIKIFNSLFKFETFLIEPNGSIPYPQNKAVIADSNAYTLILTINQQSVTKEKLEELHTLLRVLS